MMDRFIYVFDTAARDWLLGAGFLMLKADERYSLYVFANDGTLRFAELCPDTEHVLSDTLTF